MKSNQSPPSSDASYPDGDDTPSTAYPSHKPFHRDPFLLVTTPQLQKLKRCSTRARLSRESRKSKKGRPTYILHKSLKPIEESSLTGRRFPTLTRGLNCIISDIAHQWFVPSPADQFIYSAHYDRYRSIIKNPINLGVILERMERSEPYYPSEAAALEDTRRVFCNAIAYHRAASFWFLAAERLLGMLERSCGLRFGSFSETNRRRRRSLVLSVSLTAAPMDTSSSNQFVVRKLRGHLYTDKCRQLSRLIHEQLPNITYDYVEGLMHSQRYDAFCATKSVKTVVGGLLCKSFPNQDFIELCFLVVGTKFQRQGCGQALINRLKQHAERRGIKWILTYADLRAKGFFSRCGFTRGTSLPYKAWKEEIYHYTRSELMSFQLF